MFLNISRGKNSSLFCTAFHCKEKCLKTFQLANTSLLLTLKNIFNIPRCKHFRLFCPTVYDNGKSFLNIFRCKHSNLFWPHHLLQRKTFKTLQWANTSLFLPACKHSSLLSPAINDNGNKFFTLRETSFCRAIFDKEKCVLIFPG
jgi:hypothetical protein